MNCLLLVNVDPEQLREGLRPKGDGAEPGCIPSVARDSRVQKPNLEVLRDDWVFGNGKHGTIATLR